MTRMTGLTGNEMFCLDLKGLIAGDLAARRARPPDADLARETVTCLDEIADRASRGADVDLVARTDIHALDARDAALTVLTNLAVFAGNRLRG